METSTLQIIRAAAGTWLRQPCLAHDMNDNNSISSDRISLLLVLDVPGFDGPSFRAVQLGFKKCRFFGF